MADRKVVVDLLARDKASRPIERVGDAAAETGRELDKTAKAARTLDQRMADAQATVRRLAVEMADLDPGSERFKELNREVGAANRQLANLGKLRKSLGDIKIEPKIEPKVDSNRFAAALKKLGGAADAGIGIGVQLGRNLATAAVSAGGPILATGIAAALSAAIPAAGAALASGLTLAVGGGVLAGGIAAVAQDPKVKAAAKDLGESLLGKGAAGDESIKKLETKLKAAKERLAKAQAMGSDKGIKSARYDVEQLNKELDKVKNFNAKNLSLRDLAKPLVQPLINSLGILKTELNKLKPQIGGLFKSVAPALEPLTRGVAGMFTNMMPGLKSITDASVPLLNTLAEKLPELGTALSTMFTDISAAGPEMKQFFGDFLSGVALAIVGVGKLVAFLARAYVVMRDGWVDATVFMMGAFNMMVAASLAGLGILINGLATMFGFIPGIGPKLKAAAGAFNDFAAKSIGKLSALQAKINSLKGKVVYIDVEVRRGMTGKPGTTFPTAAGASTFAQGLSRGGPIEGPGPRGVDSVPILAAPGEGMLNLKGMAAVGGKSGLAALNSGQAPTGARGPSAGNTAPAMNLGPAGAGAGAALGAGLAGGIRTSTNAAVAAARSMATATLGGMTDELEIASPSKATKRFGKWVGDGLTKGLTGTRAQVIAASKKLAAGVRDAFSGRTEKRLLAGVNTARLRLVNLTNAETAAKKTLASVQSRLNDLQKAHADQAQSTADKIRSSFQAVTGEAGLDSVAQITDRLQTAVDASRVFAQNMATLGKRGAAPELLRQLAEAGPMAGGQAAAALARASAADLQRLNNLSGMLGRYATSTGKLVADGMYGAGIQAAKGLVAGLNSQLKAIDAAMLRIAKSMQTSIKRALGIRSPSRVFAELGMQSMAGYAQGVLASADMASRAVMSALAAPVQPVVPVAPVVPIGAAAGRGQQQPTIYLAGNRELTTLFRKMVRTTIGVDVRVAS